MARKQKRRSRERRHGQPAAPAAARPAPPPAAPGHPTATGAVEMRLATAAPPARRRAGRVVLEGGDPAIPLDQVPHFATDLTRIGITMAAMVILLLLGSRLIPLVIH